MPRSRTSLRALLLAAVLLPLSGMGCSILATGMWIIDPRDTEAEYKDLARQRVAVVCRAGASRDMEAAGSTHEISRKVASLLKTNVKSIELVPQEEVNDWLDNNEMKSHLDLGKALQADKVVAIELTQMSLYDGTTLYQGRAQGSITVVDVATGETTTLEPLVAAYPPQNSIPIGVPEQQFRMQFLHVLCNQIGRRFYAYDSRGDAMKEKFSGSRL